MYYLRSCNLLIRRLLRVERNYTVDCELKLQYFEILIYLLFSPAAMYLLSVEILVISYPLLGTVRTKVCSYMYYVVSTNERIYLYIIYPQQGIYSHIWKYESTYSYTYLRSYVRKYESTNESTFESTLYESTKVRCTTRVLLP